MLAHGFGATEVLGVPALVVALAGAGSVLATALLADRGRARRRLRPVATPAPLLSAAGSGRGWRILGLAGALALVLVAAFGNPLGNPAPRLLFVVVWMGLVPAALLLGPVWGAVNPFALPLAPVARRRGAAAPSGLGVWPAAAALLAFVWVEAAVPALDDPRTVLAVIGAAAVAAVAAAAAWGPRWHAVADGFEVYGDALGGLAVLGRDRRGRLRLRNPLPALAAAEPPQGLLAVLAVALGAHLFHLLGDTALWLALGAGTVAVDSALLLGLVATAYAVLRAGAWPGGRFTAAFVPLLAGYAALHHLPVLAEEGPVALQQTADLIGLDGAAIVVLATRLTPPALIAVVQVAGFLVAHVVAVVVAADIAARGYGSRVAAAQGPVRALLVASCLVGLGL